MKRDYWIDQVKVISCIGIAVGHFFQSMLKAGIYDQSFFFAWYDCLVYDLFVELFFLCSGFLYQKYCRVNSFQEWRDNLKKKAVMLGIPYVVFSTLTWIMMNAADHYANHKTNGLLETLFLKPIGQYWFLYILFFLFVITPTIRNKKEAFILIGAGIGLKMASILSGDLIKIHLFSNVMENEFWFVMGMVICMASRKIDHKKLLGAALGLLYLGISILLLNAFGRGFSWARQMIGCSAVVLLMYGRPENKGMGLFIRHTMPIFLMHTMCAASVRILLIKLGISGALVHTMIGIPASIAGPIIGAWVLEKLKLDFIINPKPILGLVMKESK